MITIEKAFEKAMATANGQPLQEISEGKDAFYFLFAEDGMYGNSYTAINKLTGSISYTNLISGDKDLDNSKVIYQK